MQIREALARVQKKATSLLKGCASFVSKKRLVFLVSGAVIAVTAIVALSIYATVERVTPEEALKDIVEEIVEGPRHPLTGASLLRPIDPKPQVFGVMIENSAEAWPLSGLDKAFLVIEAPVEANIPRFLAFYSEETDAEKIGPVRSARPYYLDWNDEFGAVYAHVGGSPEALDLIRDYETTDLNQFFESEYFYRENGDRFAPHNVYTDAQRLVASLDELDLEEPEYDAWAFQDGKSKGEKSLTVNWTDGKTYDVDWMYDVEINQYTRHQAGSVMTMEDGATILADNIVVISTDVRTIDAVGRKSIVTVGEGDALLAQNGEVFLVRWRKEDRTGRLAFYTSDGYPIHMNAGVTWIEVVSSLSQAQTIQ